MKQLLSAPPSRYSSDQAPGRPGDLNGALTMQSPDRTDGKKSSLPGEVLEGLDYLLARVWKNAHGIAHDLCGDTVSDGKKAGGSCDSRAVQARL